MSILKRSPRKPVAEHLQHLDQIIQMALDEDLGSGDITSESTIPKRRTARAEIKAKQPLIVAGVDVMQQVFATIDKELLWHGFKQDGETCEPGELIATVQGRARSLLAGERLALNLVQRLSGIATVTKRYVDTVHGTGCKILDTRKTIPGYRALEKYAVRMGGGQNHRMGLYDHFLIKDNHIAVAGSITQALTKAKHARKPKQLIEIEVRTLEEAREASNHGADIIMLDNMSVEQVSEAKEIIDGRAKIEVSGNITLDTVRKYAETGIDFISVGALTHSVPAADIHMMIEME